MPKLSLRFHEDTDLPGHDKRAVQVLNESGDVLGILPALSAEYTVTHPLGGGRLRIEVQAEGHVDVRTK
jgi:hypothetical protein